LDRERTALAVGLHWFSDQTIRQVFLSKSLYYCQDFFWDRFLEIIFLSIASFGGHRHRGDLLAKGRGYRISIRPQEMGIVSSPRQQKATAFGRG
jgi:hypothetical protein